MDEFEWDDEKATSNLEKHGIDFQGAIRIFEGSLLVTCSDRTDERRFKAIGVADDLELAVIYTWREGRRRIISARRARHHEREAYREAYPGGPGQGPN
jgi:uncharacterized protein